MILDADLMNETVEFEAIPEKHSISRKQDQQDYHFPRSQWNIEK